LSCLRRWQRSVQLGGSNLPDDVQREDRHFRCSVCQEIYDIPPQDRAAMMSDLACVRPEEVSSGLLLVTKRTSPETPMPPGAELNILLRAYIEAKAAHWREAVYLITETSESGDGGDTVIGVNLCRTLETPDVSALEGVPCASAIQEYLQSGIHVHWMNGGPVKPCVVTALVHARHLSLERRRELCVAYDLHEVFPDESGVLRGALEGILPVAMLEQEHGNFTGVSPVVVLAWAGFAQWSRTQLLGELARGSWGWSRGTVSDVATTMASQLEHDSHGLWASLRHSERMHWAPENELSRHTELRTQRTPAQQDPHAEAVAAFVRQFEVLRRGGEPPQGEAPLLRAARNRGGNGRGRPCIQQ